MAAPDNFFYSHAYTMNDGEPSTSSQTKTGKPLLIIAEDVEGEALSEHQAARNVLNNIRASVDDSAQQFVDDLGFGYTGIDDWMLG